MAIAQQKTTVAQEREAAVAETVAKIRAAERDLGLTREGVERIKALLLELAARKDLFPAADFPRPEPGGKRNSCIYRLSEDDDHRFALYLNAAAAGTSSPVHNHTTWAVIVGITGEELNKFYERTPEGGVRQTGEAMVKDGTGVAFLGDDLHSIHIDSAEGALNFHMYGLGLEQLHRREYYKPADNSWHVFPAHSDIREARPDR